MQGCGSLPGASDYKRTIGTADTYKNGKCYWMFKGQLEFGIKFDALETTAGDVLGAVFGVIIGCCCCCGIAFFLLKKMNTPDAKVGEQDQAEEVEFSKPEASQAPPPQQAPQMGQPQQMMPQQQMQQPMYGQQQPMMMQQPMGM